MRHPAPRLLFLLGGLLAAGCQPQPPLNTAHLPRGAFATGWFSGFIGAIDQQGEALNVVQYDFADPARTYGNPAEGARAVALLDYLAGEMPTNPQFFNVAPATLQEMLQARAAVRQAVGIKPDAPSQTVVDTLLAVFNALRADDEVAARAALTAPIYELPPDQTLQRLANLPYIRIANLATTDAQQERFGPANIGVRP